MRLAPAAVVALAACGRAAPLEVPLQEGPVVLLLADAQSVVVTKVDDVGSWVTPTGQPVGGLTLEGRGGVDVFAYPLVSTLLQAHLAARVTTQMPHRTCGRCFSDLSAGASCSPWALQPPPTTGHYEWVRGAWTRTGSASPRCDLRIENLDMSACTADTAVPDPCSG
jgi:hypothetical protein